LLTDSVGREDDPLTRLPYATEAPFNCYAKQNEPTCLADTRVNLLQEIHSWADGQDERYIFWLSGLAGTGKSTIARTVARRYFDNGRLGASFFFSRGGGDVGRAGKFCSTVAVQLANSVPTLRRHVCDAVVERGDIAGLSLHDQWRQLVLKPLSKLDGNGCSSSYVLVIDALDECDNDKNIRIILQLLAEARSLKGVRLRVFLTSRREVPIQFGFYQLPETEQYGVELHDISPSIVDHDLLTFLEYELRLIGKEDGQDADWPGAEVINILVKKASGLFIWAATACRFISEGQFPDERLRIVVGSVTSSTAMNDNVNGIYVAFLREIIESLLWNAGSLCFWVAIACGSIRQALIVKQWLHTLLEGSTTTPEDHLDRIYLTVLQSSVHPTNIQETKRFYSMLKAVLGSLVTLFSPLSAKSLSRLLFISDEKVKQTLKGLHAIIDIPKEKTNPLRLHHPSFRDFLLDKRRCRDPDFWLESKQVHQTLAESCIQLMSTSLKQDLCGLDAPGVLIAEVESSRVEECLPPEVQYACLYWVQHLQETGAHLRDNDQVHHFLQTHFLHWLEALSWMRRISEGIFAIRSLESIALVGLLPARQEHTTNPLSRVVTVLNCAHSFTT